MRFLLDTHILVALLEKRLGQLPVHFRSLLRNDEAVRTVSVASLWELAIKSRLGKLPISTPLSGWPAAINELGLSLLVIDERHVLSAISPEPRTKDPFDRLLLGVCAVENLRLLTLDRELAAHPLAWRDVPAVKK